MKADSMSFEQQYCDGSGVEFAVRLKINRIRGEHGGEQVVEFEHCGDVQFPIAELDWLIGCLLRIKDETNQEPQDGR